MWTAIEFALPRNLPNPKRYALPTTVATCLQHNDSIPLDFWMIAALAARVDG